MLLRDRVSSVLWQNEFKAALNDLSWSSYHLQQHCVIWNGKTRGRSHSVSPIHAELLYLEQHNTIQHSANLYLSTAALSLWKDNLAADKQVAVLETGHISIGPSFFPVALATFPWRDHYKGVLLSSRGSTLRSLSHGECTQTITLNYSTSYPHSIMYHTSETFCTKIYDDPLHETKPL